MRRVAVVYSGLSSFVRRDLAILGRHFEVVPIPWEGKRSVPRLAAGVASVDVVLSWFALDHAFVAAEVARFLGRWHAVVLGGVDCTAMPELGYGVFLDPLKKHFAIEAVRRSAMTLPVAEHLALDFMRHSGLRSIPYRVVPTGYDARTFVPGGPKEHLILTVGGLSDERTARRKGLDTFARASAALSDYAFAAVGSYAPSVREWLEGLSHGRLSFLGRLEDSDLLAAYQRARVYCQFSRYEGLPNALCEAMLCECVPCGTCLPGIADAMGNTGVLIDPGDDAAAANAIREAMGSSGSPARERIANRFPVARREKDLVEILSR